MKVVLGNFGARLVIDENVSAEEVREFMSKGFYSPSLIQEAVFCEGVTAIDAHTLEGFDRLIAVAVADTVKEIGDRAFYGCKELRFASGPDEVSMGKDVFAGCPKLEPPKPLGPHLDSKEGVRLVVPARYGYVLSDATQPLEMPGDTMMAECVIDEDGDPKDLRVLPVCHEGEIIPTASVGLFGDDGYENFAPNTSAEFEKITSKIDYIEVLRDDDDWDVAPTRTVANLARSLEACKGNIIKEGRMKNDDGGKDLVWFAALPRVVVCNDNTTPELNAKMLCAFLGGAERIGHDDTAWMKDLFITHGSFLEKCVGGKDELMQIVAERESLDEDDLAEIDSALDKEQRIANEQGTDSYSDR